jgi:polysaccharide transporter, PST family
MNIAYLRNVVWLGSIQAAQYILPFVTVPYLTRTLGPAGYGLMIYSMSMAGFLGVFCDYGFAWTATQAISKHRHDKVEIRRIFIVVMATKLLIFLCCAVVYMTLIAVSEPLRAHWGDHVLALLWTLGGVLFPGWLFQGLERMALLAILTLSARIVSIAGIFLLVRNASDVGMAILLQSLALVVAGLCALCLSLKWTEGAFTRPTVASIVIQLREAWGVFISSLSINLYTTAQTIIVGSIGGPVAAGYYGASDKCLAAAKAGFGVLGSAAMPRVAYLATHDPEEGLHFIRRLLLTAPLGFAASIVMFLFADQIVAILFGAQFVQNVVPLIKILSPIPFILNLSICFATLFMFNYGFRAQWSRMIIAACALSLTALGILHFVVPIEKAAAISSLLTETFILLVSVAFFYRAGLRNYVNL